MTKKSKMLHGNLVVLMCNLPWEWSTDYTNQTATILSKTNIVICYMLTEAFSIKEHVVQKKLPKMWKKKSMNLYLYYPLQWLPFRRFNYITRTNEYLNIFLIKLIIKYFEIIYKPKKKILWVFDPQFYPLYKRLKSILFTLYDCVDYFSGSTLDKKQSEFIGAQETELLKKADLVVTISHTLKKLHSRIRKNIHIVPQGFRVSLFKKNKKTKLLLPHEKPIVGYIGGINFRLDYGLLLRLTNKFPQYNFIFIGPVQNDSNFFQKKCLPLWKTLLKKSNVLWYDSKPKKEIPSIIKQFDIGIIPYNILLAFNLYCYPMKFFEYLYCSIPILSTYIKELARFPNFVTQANSFEEWEENLKQLKVDKNSNHYTRLLRNFAKDNSWENKINIVSDLINKSYEGKNKRHN